MGVGGGKGIKKRDKKGGNRGNGNGKGMGDVLMKKIGGRDEKQFWERMSGGAGERS